MYSVWSVRGTAPPNQSNERNSCLENVDHKSRPLHLSLSLEFLVGIHQNANCLKDHDTKMKLPMSCLVWSMINFMIFPHIPSLKLIAKAPVKMDGWKTFSFPFGAFGLFSRRLWLLVSGRLRWTPSTSEKNPRWKDETLSFCSWREANIWRKRLKQLDFLSLMIIGYTTPKINIEPQNPPNWKGESSSKPTLLGSMLIFQDISCLKNDMPPWNGDKSGDSKYGRQKYSGFDVNYSGRQGINKITFDKIHWQRESRHFLASQRESSPR